MKFKMQLIALVVCTSMLCGCANFLSYNIKDEYADKLIYPERSIFLNQRDVSVVFVHGIGCHEIGYSAAFQYRFAERLGLQRDASQVANGRQVVQFWGASDDALDTEVVSHADFVPFKQIINVEDPSYADFVKDNQYTHLFPDAGVREKIFAKRLDKFKDIERKKYPDPAKALSVNPVPFSIFSDSCLDRSARNAALPSNSLLGPGVTVRRFVGHGYTVTFYEVLWSPISEKQKIKNLGYDFVSGEPGVSRTPNLTKIGERALINRSIKDGVLNAGIPDAVFYVGRGNEDVKRIVKSAICLSQVEKKFRKKGFWNVEETCKHLGVSNNDAALPKTLFFSESLGSRILLDSIAEISFANDAGVGSLFGHPSPVVENLVSGDFFMFANQLPVIEVGLGNYGAYFGSEELVGPPIKPRDDNIVDKCISDAVPAMKDVEMTADYTIYLRKFKAALDSSDPAAQINSPSMVFVAKTRYSALTKYHQEIGVCTQAIDRLTAKYTPSENIHLTYDPELIRDLEVAQKRLDVLRRPGPSGLDLYLQGRALAEIIDTPVDNESAREELRSRLNRQTFHVYAFSDANDLLSWEVSDEFKSHFAMVDFINVQTRVALPAIPVKGSWGAWVDPARAHLNYRFSTVAMDAIMCVLGEPKHSERPCTDFHHVDLDRGK